MDKYQQEQILLPQTKYFFIHHFLNFFHKTQCFIFLVVNHVKKYSSVASFFTLTKLTSDIKEEEEEKQEEVEEELTGWQMLTSLTMSPSVH